MDENAVLALIDAVLTTASIVCMSMGYRAVRRKRIPSHKRWMLGALATSAAFMGVFVLRYVRHGRTEFHGEGLARVLYQIAWYSHEPIAVVSVPLVLCAAILGLRGSTGAHREVAQIALPIWLYAAVSGVAVYLFLYRR